MELERDRCLRECCRDNAAFEKLKQILAEIEDQHRQAQEQILFQASLLNQICNAVIAADKEGKIVFWNRYAETLYQWQAEEALGKSIYDTVVPQQSRWQVKSILTAITNTGSWQGELALRRKDGSEFLADMTNAVLRDVTGKSIGFVGISVDATERKRAQEVLARREEQYRALYEDNPSMYFTVNAGGTVLSVNQFGAEQLAYTPSELVGQSFLKVICKEDRPAVRQHLITCMQQPAAVARLEVRQIRKDGSLLWVKQVARAMTGPEQGAVILIVCQDITQQKQIQEALLVSQAKNRALLEAIPDLMFRLAKDGTILDFKAAKDFGKLLSESAFLGKKLERVWPTEPGQLTMQYAERALQTGKMQVFEYQLPTSSLNPQFQVLSPEMEGEAVLLNTQIQEETAAFSLSNHHRELPNPAGTASTFFEVRIVVSGEAEVLAIIRDITDRKQAEVKLRLQTERERLMGAIAANIRRSLNLSDILNSTVDQVRQFLQCDRVLIYRFQPDWSGVMAVESVADGWSSVIGTKIQDSCFTENYVQAYRQGRIQVAEDIYTAGLSQCHIDLLAYFQIRANLVVPILTNNTERSILSAQFIQNSNLKTQNSQLWGLLIAHQCSGPRKWQRWESDWLQQLATQVGIAIQQSSLFGQVKQLNTDLENQVKERTRELQKTLEFAAGVRRITDKIRDSLDEGQILQTSVIALAGVLKADYCCAALYNAERTQATICYEATQEHLGSAVGCVINMADTPKAYSRLLRGEYYQSCELGDLSVPELCRHLAAKLLCPISSDDQGVIGHLAVFNPVCYVLGKTEILLVQQVANQCAIAIRQARLYQASLAQVEELAKLNRLKDDFLSTVSHELRSPMANMKMAIHMLQAAPDSSRRERYLEILRAECDRENELINDLLDLQKLEASAYLLHTEVLNLCEWLPTIIDPFYSRISHRQQTFKVDYPGDLPPLISDPPSLRRILIELLHNACKYTPADSEITLSVRYLDLTQLSIVNSPNFHVWRLAHPSAPVHLFTIRNQAEISPAELPRIFEKFYRVPNSDPWQQGGTGLGLALAKKLVETLDGTIEVDSSAGWTTFTIALPSNLEVSGEQNDEIS